MEIKTTQFKHKPISLSSPSTFRPQEHQEGTTDSQAEQPRFYTLKGHHDKAFFFPLQRNNFSTS